MTGSEEGVDEDDDYFTAEWKAYQHMFDKETDVVLPWFPQNDNTCKLDTSEIGELTLKFGADGKVSAIAGNRNYLMQDSWLSVIDYDEYLETVTARLYIDGYNAKDDCAVGYDLILTIPCDRNEKASASKIMIEVTDTIIGW